MNSSLGLSLLATSALALSAMPAHAAPSDATPPVATAASACAALTELRLPDLRVDLAERVVPAGAWTALGTAGSAGETVRVDRPFCRVHGRIEGEIQFELWLPEPADWTGRFYAAGNGGMAGFIRYGELGRGIMRGMAAMSTDTGHTRAEQRWWRDAPRRMENYAWRGLHLATANAKAVTAAYYGRPAAHSYFMGCSGGGMQAINEAARYPADYDGVVAGAHGVSYPAVQARMMLGSRQWFAQDPAARLDEADWRALHDAALAACDGQDGKRDGMLERPEACVFDPAKVRGLTPAKLATARAALRDIVAADGTIVLDRVMPGAIGRDLPATEGQMLFGDWLRGDPQWDIHAFDPLRDITWADTTIPGVSLAGADLTLFQRRGGRLIGYQGGGDMTVPAAATLRFYRGVHARLGPDRTRQFLRYFQIPGMSHCGGGGVPDVIGGMGQADAPVVNAQHDLLSAIIAWVEQGRAPDHMIATQMVDGRAVATRRVDPHALTDR
jgi:feruloyl esterase